MKIRFVFIVLILVIFMLFTISSATAETDIESAKGMLIAYLIDDYIQRCQSKCKLSDSRSKNLRKAAALAALKVEYLEANKKELIGQILETEQSIKKYKVHYYLNARFLNYYESKSNLQQK
ncbi:MAG: hypothetical protein KJP23_22965 [Deltaproteobacteria bacterium]|nr:hypothetical protein [Deltaproteobacteria bacterium]